jgi:hypothetical protein
MVKRQWTYFMLAIFAGVMLIVLMLDDPADRQARFQSVNATLQVERGTVLFPDLTTATQVNGIEVLDVTTGTGILLMRDDSGLWYAPAIPDNQVEVPAANINQSLANDAAAALVGMTAPQWYDATSQNLEIFGFQPDPAVRVRFQAVDGSGRLYEPVVLEIGDANPDRVAYYVWLQDTERIYLVHANVVNLLLNMLTESLQIAPETGEAPMEQPVKTPVP